MGNKATNRALQINFSVDISFYFAYNKYEMAIFYHNYDKEMVA